MDFLESKARNSSSCFGCQIMGFGLWTWGLEDLMSFFRFPVIGKFFKKLLSMAEGFQSWQAEKNPGCL